jgi:hypothetical protein
MGKRLTVRLLQSHALELRHDYGKHGAPEPCRVAVVVLPPLGGDNCGTAIWPVSDYGIGTAAQERQMRCRVFPRQTCRRAAAIHQRRAAPHMVPAGTGKAQL